jgi:hypothetical protein
MDQAFLFDREIDATTYASQRDRLRDELTAAKLELGEADAVTIPAFSWLRMLSLAGGVRHPASERSGVDTIHGYHVF